MPSHNIPEKPIYFIKEEKYTGSQPAFYERSAFPQASLLEENWLTIKNEMLGTGIFGMASPTYNPNQAKGADKWKMIIFYNYLWKNKTNCNNYPVTHNILKQINGLTFAAFNLLEPNAEIKAHHGDTNTTIRCHLGIEIPTPLPICGLEVNGEKRKWENGETLLFSDAHLHRAWNYSKYERYVLVVDIIRPEYEHKKKWICAGVLASLSLKFINTKVNFMHFPFVVFSPIFNLLRLAWWVKLQLN